MLDNPPSDDDHGSPAVKRGTRACDRCRKIKSKCEPTEGDRCKNCTVAGTPCTYHGPSFKRGPPKGYIHAIEQRWHQVECVLATVMASPRAESIIVDLCSDPFARNILDRVDAGPYGQSGRLQPQSASDESLYAAIMGPQNRSTHEDRRVRRQSRVTREIVSTEDPTSLATPTKAWQDQLSRRLDGAQAYPTPLPPHTSPSLGCVRIDQQASSSRSPESPRRTRRRMEVSYGIPGDLPGPQWNNNPSEDSGPGPHVHEVDDAVDSFGHLSLDDKNDIHYYGPASGLPLLARSDRAKVEPQEGANGLWQFNHHKVEPVPPILTEQSEDSADDVPGLPFIAVDVQAHLVDLYFTYVHPSFPILNKEQFMIDFNRLIGRYDWHSVPSNIPPPTEREPIQRVGKLLLLAMFSHAARYSSDSSPTTDNEVWRAGAGYAADAHKILRNIYQISRPPTCQALLLLGYREFGLGSTEQGWLYSGLALRMAVDLGMNRNADNWTEDSNQLFSAADKQTRKQIWWSCCITDKMSSMWLGRPVMFRANDFTTHRPEVLPEDEEDLWQPYPAGALGLDFTPTPSRVLSTFREACHLSASIIEIMDQIYSVSPLPEPERRSALESLEARLHKWMFGLPDHLRYSTNSLVTPLPHILTLHMEYYAAMLLLHRAFIPNWDERTGAEQPSAQADPLAMKCFDICQSTAAQISSIATVYDEKYGLDRSPPFLSIYLQSAGIMHIITLKRRPQNPQASLGLRQCIAALEHMKRIWPSAVTVLKLLQGAAVQLGREVGSSPRQKRSLQHAFGAERSSDILEHEAFGGTPLLDSGQQQQGIGTDARIVAHTLGLDVPGVEASTSFYPGYQWWPRPGDEGFMYGSNFPPQAPMQTPGTSQAGTMAETDMTSAPMDDFAFDQQLLSGGFVGPRYRSRYSSLDPNVVFQDHSASGSSYRGSGS